MSPVRKSKYMIKVNRLEALTDGVFAIAMTLLVLGITVPELGKYPRPDELLKALMTIWPSFFHYALSFLILGRVWISLTHQFELIEYTDRTHLYINLFILMSVVLIPFTTTLIAEYPGIYVAEFIFHLNFLCLGGAIFGQLRYSIHGRRLAKESINPKLVAKLEIMNLTLPVVAILGLLIAFWSPRWSTAPYLIILLAPAFIKSGKLSDELV